MKQFVLAASLLLMLSSVQAMDFGLNFENSSALQGQEAPAFSQRNSATLWLSHDTEMHHILAEALYEFRGDFAEQETTIVPYRFDVQKLYWEGRFPELFGPGSGTLFRVGRQEFADSTRHIASGKADGIYLRHSFSTVELGLMTYYTGLLSQKDANIIISQADYNAYLDSASASYFAPSKLVGAFSGRFLEIFNRHDLSIDLIGQVDLNALDPMHTCHVQTSLEGRPLQWLKYRGYLIGEFWADPDSSISVATGARIQFNVPELAGLVTLVGVDWACGSDQNFRQYIPLNQAKVAQMYPAAFSDLLVLSLNAASRPADGLGVGLNGAVLFRGSNNQPADPDFVVNGTERYLGSEALVSLDWTVGSDLQLGLRCGAFLPNTSPQAFGTDALPRYLVSFDATLKF